MASSVSEDILKKVVALICQNIGFQAIQTSSLNILTDLLARYLKEIAVTSQKYAEHDSRSCSTFHDVEAAFRELNISVDESIEYISNVEPVTFSLEVPNFPYSKSSNLNFLKPGAREILSRPLHIHDHLPPMYPEDEEGYGFELKQELSNSNDNAELPENVEAKLIRGCANNYEDDDGEPAHEIDSVMMTTSGFISSAREGKLSEAVKPSISFHIPKHRVPLRSPTSLIKKKVGLEKIIRHKKNMAKEQSSTGQRTDKPKLPPPKHRFKYHQIMSKLSHGLAGEPEIKFGRSSIKSEFKSRAPISIKTENDGETKVEIKKHAGPGRPKLSKEEKRQLILERANNRDPEKHRIRIRGLSKEEELRRYKERENELLAALALSAPCNIASLPANALKVRETPQTTSPSARGRKQSIFKKLPKSGVIMNQFKDKHLGIASLTPESLAIKEERLSPPQSPTLTSVDPSQSPASAYQPEEQTSSPDLVRVKDEISLLDLHLEGSSKCNLMNVSINADTAFTTPNISETNQTDNDTRVPCENSTLPIDSSNDDIIHESNHHLEKTHSIQEIKTHSHIQATDSNIVEENTNMTVNLKMTAEKESSPIFEKKNILIKEKDNNLIKAKESTLTKGKENDLLEIKEGGSVKEKKTDFVKVKKRALDVASVSDRSVDGHTSLPLTVASESTQPLSKKVKINRKESSSKSTEKLNTEKVKKKEKKDKKDKDKDRRKRDKHKTKEEKSRKSEKVKKDKKEKKRKSENAEQVPTLKLKISSDSDHASSSSKSSKLVIQPISNDDDNEQFKTKIEKKLSPIRLCRPSRDRSPSPVLDQTSRSSTPKRAESPLKVLVEKEHAKKDALVPSLKIRNLVKKSWKGADIECNVKPVTKSEKVAESSSQHKESLTIPPLKIKSSTLSTFDKEKPKKSDKKEKKKKSPTLIKSLDSVETTRSTSVEVTPAKSVDVQKTKKISPSTASSSAALVTETVGPIGHFVDDAGNEVWICPTCGKQDDGSPMIGCDACDDWYHWFCVGIHVAPNEDEKWYCPRCLSQNKNITSITVKKKRGRKRKNFPE